MPIALRGAYRVALHERDVKARFATYLVGVAVVLVFFSETMRTCYNADHSVNKTACMCAGDKQHNTMPESPLVDRKKIRAVYARLVESYGKLTLRPGGDPLDELIGTILSQNTSDVNSWRAYAQLRSMYPSWELTVTGIFLKDRLLGSRAFKRVVWMASTDRISPFYGAFDRRLRPFCSRLEDIGTVSSQKYTLFVPEYDAAAQR